MSTQKAPKVVKVKNKAPAEVQITAEQLLREAKERDLEILPPPPKQKISDPVELADYQQRKRKSFEDNLRKNRIVVTNWTKYAQWEESQKDLQRARSIWERALDNDHRVITFWMKYAEMEMKNKQVNHARNVWDRAVTIMPRVKQFWEKYTLMEEMLDNVAGARQVFQRWMVTQPEEQAWFTFINFELRYYEVDNARAIFEQMLNQHYDVKYWLKYARFEEQHGSISRARAVYERAVGFFGDEYIDKSLFIAFARFEEKRKEFERARVIYQYALERLPKDETSDLYKAYATFEKRFGDKASLENVIISKRRHAYEQEIKINPRNYDAWFDYLRLIEDESELEQVRDAYERAISNFPLTAEKADWRRYIYLWIKYALFEELKAIDMPRTQQVYTTCLKLIPHEKFTFGKIWILYAQFEVRNMDLDKARKALGTALGKCPKDKIFRAYIELEIRLREFERCRILYEKFIEFSPENCVAWMKYAELETLLGDTDRARAIYELALNQDRLDMPELIWKAYIDFEVEQGEPDKVRSLYDRLLQRTTHVKVWISYAKFEHSLTPAEQASDDVNANINAARQIYERANKTLREADDKESRALLLEAWRKFEEDVGDEEALQKVEKKMPRLIKKRQKVTTADGDNEAWQEVISYIFPEDEAKVPYANLLAAARNWSQAEN